MKKNILFVQFYSITDDYCSLFNGFSSVYKECKNMGELVWIEFKSKESWALNRWSYEQKWNMQEYEKRDLPIIKGTVYVSVFWHAHILQTYVWAKKYPNIKFIVGGPPIMLNPYTPDDTVPDNLIIKKGLAEKVIFNKNTVNLSWDISLPADKRLQKVKTIDFTYLVDRKCYWKKCIFCKYYRNKEELLNRSVSNLYLPIKNKKYSIVLQIPSITPKFLLTETPKLIKSPHVQYGMFLRGNNNMILPLKKTLANCSSGIGPDPKQLAFSIGVEFPSNRMLEYMKKGATTYSILKTIELLKQYECIISVNLIRDWTNLTKNDIKEAKNFIENLYAITGNNIIFGLSTLLIIKDTTLDHIYKGPKKNLRTKPFDIGIYKPILNKNQKILNNEYKKICSKFNIHESYTNE